MSPYEYFGSRSDDAIAFYNILCAMYFRPYKLLHGTEIIAMAELAE